MGKAQKDVSRKKKQQRRGRVGVRAREACKTFFDKKLVPVYQILVYPMIGHVHFKSHFRT